MKITIDDEKYAKLQTRVMDEIIETIISQLENAGVEKDKICELTADLSFCIAAILDASQVMELDGKPVLPFLAFAADDERSEIIANEYGSDMHEDAYGKVYTRFGKL